MEAFSEWYIQSNFMYNILFLGNYGYAVRGEGATVKVIEGPFPNGTVPLVPPSPPFNTPPSFLFLLHTIHFLISLLKRFPMRARENSLPTYQRIFQRVTTCSVCSSPFFGGDPFSMVDFSVMAPAIVYPFSDASPQPLAVYYNLT